MSDFKIGVSSHGKTAFTGKAPFFYIKDNEDNVYRVLPPLFSLAESGKYAKWYSIHRGIRGSDGKQKPFRCNEETDRKSGLITHHCALCDKTRELEAQYKMAKDKGATWEQLQNLRLKMIMPVQAEKKYYINVVNQENKIGVLPISSRSFNALKALAEEQDKKGTDITGVNGLFLNFKKQVKFKGDKDAVHSVSIHLNPSNDGSYRPIVHQLTADFIERLKTEAADLDNLFKSLSDEEVAALAAASDADRVVLVDKIFARPEKAQNSLESNEVTIPGTSAVGVNRLEIDPAGAGVTAKTFTTAKPAPVSQPPVQTAPAMASKTLSDEDFAAMFMPK